MSSTVHKMGRIDFDDLHGERRYARWRAYAQSKLANLLVAHELERRLAAAGAGVKSVGCHPGYAATNLQFVGPRMSGSSLGERVMGLANRLFAQSAEQGALPLLYASAAPDVSGADTIGPDGPAEMWGHPKKVAASRRARDRATAERLWEISRAQTGVRFEALG